MFITLLIVTFLISLTTSFIVVKLFDNSLEKILTRILSDDVAFAWLRYLKFAIYVVGISGGIRIWQLEKYITPATEHAPNLVLTNERWVLEIYRTIISTLQSIAWMLLIFFIVALIAFAIIRIFESKQQKTGSA